MSAPIIDSIVANPATPLNPGQSATITVTAHDPDQSARVLTVTVKDAAGNTGTGTITLNVSDPLTYTATVVGGGSITGGGASNVFTYTA